MQSVILYSLLHIRLKKYILSIHKEICTMRVEKIKFTSILWNTGSFPAPSTKLS